MRLLTNAAGCAFVDTYYRLSPAIADKISQSPALKSAVRVVLKPILSMSRFVTQTRQQAVVTARPRSD